VATLGWNWLTPSAFEDDLGNAFGVEEQTMVFDTGTNWPLTPVIANRLPLCAIQNPRSGFLLTLGTAV